MCNSCTMYVVLLAIFLIIGITVSSAFIYFCWYLKKDNIKGNSMDTTIYQTYKWEM